MRPGITLAFAFTLASAAFAQCEQYQHGLERSVAGVNGPVYQMVSWDPDGTGPAGPQLVVAGLFTTAGAVGAANVAAWDGHAWRALGSPGVHIATMVVFRDQIYLAGTSVTQPGSLAGVYRWSGSDWAAVVPPGTSPVAAAVSSLAVWNDRLVAAGAFTAIGGTPANQIAAWDGQRWSAIGQGLPAPAAGIAVFGGMLYAASSNTIRRFSTSGDATLLPPPPISGQTPPRLVGAISRGVCAVTSANGGGGSGVSTSAAFWNGSAWAQTVSLGPGGGGPLVEFRGRTYGPRALASYLGSVNNGGVQDIDNRLSTTLPVATAVGGCGSLCLYDGGLAVGGTFVDIGGVSARSVALYRQDGGWQVLGAGISTDRVIAISSFGSDRYAIGSRTNSYNYETSIWRFESGIPRLISTPSSGVRAILASPDGLFASFGGGAFRRFAANQWTELPAPSTHQALSLARFGADTWAAGEDGVFRFDGTRWTTVSTTPATVLAVGGEVLYVGGSFTAISGIAARNIAAWDGRAFAPIADGLPQPVAHIAADGARLFATQTNFAHPGESVWYFDAGAWSRIGLTESGTGDIHAISLRRGRLYAVGDFHSINDHPFPSAASWTPGSGWAPMGEGPSPYSQAECLDVGSDDLIIGGVFYDSNRYSGDLIATWRRPAGIATSDMDCNGGVDGDDVGAFYAAWDAGDPEADLDRDGAVTSADVAAFFYLWEGAV